MPDHRLDYLKAPNSVSPSGQLYFNGGNGDKVADLFAGVGVVKAASAKSEWQELNLKTKPMEALLREQ